MPTKSRPHRSARISLRATSWEKRVIAAVARRRNLGVTDFILQTAVAQAERELADQTDIQLSPARWGAFQKALETPARVHPRLQRLLTEPSILDHR